MTDVSNASIIFFNSGTTEISLNTLNTLSNLKSKKLELLGIGIKEIKDFLDNQEQPAGERIEIPNNISDEVETDPESESATD